jgi:hypothetical protein
MTLGELYNKPTPGTAPGTCYICGRETERGWAGPPSDAFTAQSQCFGGAVHCEWCRSLLKDNRFRFYSWLLLPGEVQVADKEHRDLLWSTLLNPPEGPWGLYQTQGGQKQGWISVANCVNASSKAYRVAVDWLDKPVYLQAAYVADHAPVIDGLRGVEVTKDSLRSGSWSMRDYRRAQEADMETEYDIACHEAGNPQWEVLVNAHYAPK